MTEQAPEIDMSALREEYDELNSNLRAHNEKRIVLQVDDYTRYLRRSLEIMALFQFTTAGPKKSTSKSPKKAQNQQPVSLMDL
jgi:hypothetical protein